MEIGHNDACNNNCSLFDFMANTLGIKVLHPGGYKATGEMLSFMKLKEESHVLDLACGVGTSSFYLSKSYNCKITGIDISNTLINSAIENSKKHKNSNVTFKVADAYKLPFPDNTFDAVIAQAFFILVDNKELALDEIYRVLKPGGYFGSLELSWFKSPSKEAYSELAENACDTLIPRMLQFCEWEKFYKSKKFNHIKTIKNKMPAGMIKLIKTEGFVNFIKILIKMITNSTHRKKMMAVQNVFRKYEEFIGYGIYCHQK